MKRVLLIVVDGWTARLVKPAIERGDLPLIQRLAGAGTLSLDCVSIFPSITPAATASIVTGQYPAQHGIAGMSWWNASTGDVLYFGDDVWTAMRRGAGEFLRGFLLQLNGVRLKAPTLFQVAERQRKRAACFNHLIFRGDVGHRVSYPRILRLLPGVSGPVTVHGPSWLCLGDFVTSTDPKYDVDAPGGVLNRFGIDDEGTSAFLRDLPTAAALPDFTVAYFPDYDFDSHDRGPDAALSTLRKLDDRLADVFDGWGGLARVLDDLCIVMTADHSHSQIKHDADAGIDIDRVLAKYRSANPATGWNEGDDLLICPNMRSAEIFFRRQTGPLMNDVTAQLLDDARVDQVIWREQKSDDRDQYHVATRDRGELRFRRAPDNARSAPADEYGTRWEVEGQVEALEITIEGDAVRYGAYPNALERIANGVDHPRTGRLWATARPGYEFDVTGQEVHHGGGSHGTLHDLDSRVPLLVAGAPGVWPLTSTPRIVDVAPICADVLGIRFENAAGEGRA